MSVSQDVVDRVVGFCDRALDLLYEEQSRRPSLRKLGGRRYGHRSRSNRTVSAREERRRAGLALCDPRSVNVVSRRQASGSAWHQSDRTTIGGRHVYRWRCSRSSAHHPADLFARVSQLLRAEPVTLRTRSHRSGQHSTPFRHTPRTGPSRSPRWVGCRALARRPNRAFARFARLVIQGERGLQAVLPVTQRSLNRVERRD